MDTHVVVVHKDVALILSGDSNTNEHFKSPYELRGICAKYGDPYLTIEVSENWGYELLRQMRDVTGYRNFTQWQGMKAVGCEA